MSLSPAVLWRVQAHGLDFRDIQATGPKHNILKGDVLHYLRQRTVGDSIDAGTGTANNTLPTGPSIMLVLTEANLRAIDEFIQETRGTMMRTHLLVKAICQAIARTCGPATTVALHEAALPVRIGQAGSPLSSLIIQGGGDGPEAEDVYLRINLDCTQVIPPAPLRITVHLSATGHVTLDMVTNSSASVPSSSSPMARFDQSIFMRHLYDNISDPFLMLL